MVDKIVFLSNLRFLLDGIKNPFFKINLLPFVSVANWKYKSTEILLLEKLV